MSEPPVDDIPIHPKETDDIDPDLEDGEIDDDDDDACPQTVSECKVDIASNVKEIMQPPKPAQFSNKLTKVAQIVAIDLESEVDKPSPSAKTKKPQAVEDDHASSIEHAIASALKKKGIEPPMPKLLEPRNEPDTVKASGYGQSRSSRRRKRKRQRDELKKELREKKRINIELQESITQKSLNATSPPPVDEDDLDDYEMLNVRGGSPPSATVALVPTLLAVQKYDSQDENSTNSYDSYVSQPPPRYEGRRSNKLKESRKSRRERARAREDREDRNGRSSDKKARPDSQSEDSKHRQEPRKLELCKFYLMECCAKKEKCSYMHSDFPCKYYYLGMDCVYGDLCKFSHGKPLTEQLRNILLKHLETAPKEILGAFKRICRDTAIDQMATRHTELCKKFGVENKLTTLTTNTSSNRAGGNSEHHQPSMQQQQPQHQPQIPSLLDIVIKPPTLSESNSQQKEKQRKSRWCDNSNSKNDSSINISETEKLSNYSTVELKALTGMVSEDIIEKLSQVGVVYLEQVNQLRFGQLAKIGLTIADISELEINAQRLERSEEDTGANKEISEDDPDKSKISKFGDVDMRLISSGSNTCMPLPSSYLKDPPECSNSNSNSSNSGAILVDYSQYLKDSNLSFDRGDIFDDEKDEEQLVIDDDLGMVEETPTDEAEMEDMSAQDVINVVEFPPKYKNSDMNPVPTEKSFNSLSTQIDDAKDQKNFINSWSTHIDDEKDQRDPRSKAAQSSGVFMDKFTFLGSASDIKRGSPCSPEIPIYERPSMYDYNPKYAEDDKKSKSDREILLNSLSFPFQPAPATEVDASINSHLPIPWKLYEVEVPRQSYSEQSFTTNQTIDPRVRRILQLPELPKTNTAAALAHGRSSSASTASPENVDIASPSYYTPPSNPAGSHSDGPCSSIYSIQIKEDRDKASSKNSITTASRVDPRRAAAVSNTSSNTKTTMTSAAQKQNIEIRNLLQKSNWYKNLNSTSKIMVNQQLALVSTELKKFHQESSDKVFDSQFITGNPTLQQILTSLGIYIDYKGEVSHLEIDNANQNQSIGSTTVPANLNQMPPNMQQVPYMSQQQKNLSCIGNSTMMPNINHMPPVPFMQQPQLEFLRGPPPNIPPPIGGMQYISNVPQQISILPPFTIGPPPPTDMSSISRPSLLGMPPVIAPVGNPFNQSFPNVLSGPRLSMLGASPDFSNIRGIQQQNMQRNFGNQRHNRNSRQNN